MGQNERLSGRRPEVSKEIQENFREFAAQVIANKDGIAYRARILPENLACIWENYLRLERSYFVHLPYEKPALLFTEQDSITFPVGKPLGSFLIDRMGEFRQDMEGKRLMVDQFLLGGFVDQRNGRSNLEYSFRLAELGYNYPRQFFGRYVDGVLVKLGFWQNLIGTFEVANSGYGSSFCELNLQKLLEEGQAELKAQKSTFVCRTDGAVLDLERTVDEVWEYGKVVSPGKRDVIRGIPLVIDAEEIVRILIDPELWNDPFNAPLERDASWRREGLVSLLSIKWERT